MGLTSKIANMELLGKIEHSDLFFYVLACVCVGVGVLDL